MSFCGGARRYIAQGYAAVEHPAAQKIRFFPRSLSYGVARELLRTIAYFSLTKVLGGVL